MTITAISVPRVFLARGYEFNDPDGGGHSIHFSDDVLIDLYERSGEIQILKTPTVVSISEGEEHEQARIFSAFR